MNNKTWTEVPEERTPKACIFSTLLEPSDRLFPWLEGGSREQWMQNSVLLVLMMMEETMKMLPRAAQSTSEGFLTLLDPLERGGEETPNLSSTVSQTTGEMGLEQWPRRQLCAGGTENSAETSKSFTENTDCPPPPPPLSLSFPRTSAGAHKEGRQGAGDRTCHGTHPGSQHHC